MRKPACRRDADRFGTLPISDIDRSVCIRCRSHRSPLFPVAAAPLIGRKFAGGAPSFVFWPIPGETQFWMSAFPMNILSTLFVTGTRMSKKDVTKRRRGIHDGRGTTSPSSETGAIKFVAETS